jgi:hypothetical protein
MVLTKKNIPFTLGMLAFTLAVFTSCNDTAGTPKPPATDFSRKLDSINHFFPLDKAHLLADVFKANKDSLKFGSDSYAIPFSETFNLDIISRLTTLKNCVGLRIYYGLDKTDKKVKLMIAGVDANGYDIYLPSPPPPPGAITPNGASSSTESVAETGQWGPPPPYPSVTSKTTGTDSTSNTSLLNK